MSTPKKKAAPKGYPSPEELNLPEIGEISPDQTYFLGWQTQHARLWLLTLGLALALFVSLGVNVLQVVRYKPAYIPFEFQSGFLVAYNDKGEQTVDDVVYRPGPLRAMLRTFIENRYGYNYQNLQKLNRAIEFMDAKAVEVERNKLQQADLGNRILKLSAVWRLQIDMDQWSVEALGDGRFKVKVPGTAFINDALNHTDPANPFPKDFTVELTVATVPATETNPYGYIIVETGTDIIF